MSYHEDPYRALRKAMCFRIADDLRAAALQADDFGHEMREKAFAIWMQNNPYATWVVAGHLADIGARGEEMR